MQGARVTAMKDLLADGREIPVVDAAGNLVDTYTLHGVHARGGQGVVYRLESPDGRPAVLKVPDVKGLLAAEVEVRILDTQLPPHHNIMRLIGTSDLQGVKCPVFEWAYENPYQRLNRPYQKNATKRFRGVAPRTPLPATTALEMVQEVLSALEHLHRHSYVHADIKPANILVHLGGKETWLSNADYFGRIQQRAYRTILADFGSVRSLSFLKDKQPGDEVLAPAEYTPIFAPPEIFRATDRRAGLFIDVYQVGLLLYQLITGHVPFEHELPQVARGGLSFELVELKRSEGKGKIKPYDPERLRKARHQDVVFAEAFASQRMRDRFFEDVATVVAIATDPDPDKRPSAATLRREVIHMFELRPPKLPRPDGRPQVTLANPAWHLTRVNRLSVAARVPDPPRSETTTVDPMGETEQVKPLSPRGSIPTEPIPADDQPAPSPTPARGGRGSGSDRLKFMQLNAAFSHLSTSAKANPRPKPKPEPEEPHLQMADEAPPDAEDEDVLHGLRVALVDDDRLVLTVISRTLRGRGCLVRAFQDPEMALEEISRDLPDMALIDMQMPVLDGLELIRQLNERLGGRPYPLVVLSSVEDEEVLQQAYRYGVQDYLIKPVTEAELAVKLENALRAHREAGPPDVPRELGGFELREQIRRNGLAVVFAAVDLWSRYEDPRKWVKVLRPDLTGDPAPLLQMRREIDIVSGCDHPGVVTALETGLEGRFLYFASDAFPARTLAREVRESGALVESEVVDLLEDLAGALQHLHEQGVLVGDLTPESVGRNEDGRLVICELGRARWLLPLSRGDEPPLPATRYSAPELLEGAVTLDARADLFSLGVCALEAFSAKPAVRDRITGEINTDRLCEGMGAGLRSVLERLVAAEPETRMASAADLLADVQRLR